MGASKKKQAAVGVPTNYGSGTLVDNTAITFSGDVIAGAININHAKIITPDSLKDRAITRLTGNIWKLDPA